ncbi:MAG: site-specific DNA-methyltransferase [Patescibacteria group bacterium]
MMLDQNKEKTLLQRISELETELKKIKKQKTYGLVWEDKPEEIVMDCKRNIPILQLKEKRKEIDPVIITDKSKDENILIEGDNYHALTVLNYTHKNSFDVIYIDPPYNTGNQDFAYNDKFVDLDDNFRHSKWVSFMYNRLTLARNLLKKTGLIFISIDDNEYANLKSLCDIIFGENNYRASITVKGNPRGRDYGGVARMHDYVLVYSSTDQSEIFSISDENKEFPFQDALGGFETRELRNRNIAFNDKNRPNLYYPFYINPNKQLDNGFFEISLDKKPGWFELFPKESQGIKTVWRWGKSKSLENLNIEIAAKKMQDGGYQIVEKYRKKEKMVRSIWDDKDVNTEKGTLLLKEILEKKIFGYPKPVEMIKRIIEMGSITKNIKVLDFFAGSGTTGHAVLELNKQDGGNRKFILCTNNENNICEEVTYERIKRVMKGYKNKKGEQVEGLGGNLRYYKTDLVDIEKLHGTPDNAKIKLTYQAGEMIALRESTLNEVEKNNWWQIFEGLGKITAIYFKEDKEKLHNLVGILEKRKQPAALYIFSWGKNEYTNEYSSDNIHVEDIPEPILEVYKEINRL